MTDEDIPELPDFEIARKIGLKRLVFNISVLTGGVLSAVLVGSLLGLLIYVNLPENNDDSLSLSVPVVTAFPSQSTEVRSKSHLFSSSLPVSLQKEGYKFIESMSKNNLDLYEAGTDNIYSWSMRGKENNATARELGKKIGVAEELIFVKAGGLWEWSYEVAISQPVGLSYPIEKAIEDSKELTQKIGYGQEFLWEGSIEDGLTIVRGTLLVDSHKMYPSWVFKYAANGKLVFASGFLAEPIKTGTVKFLSLKDTIKRSNSLYFLGFTLVNKNSSTFNLLPGLSEANPNSNSLVNKQEKITLPVYEVVINNAEPVYVPFYDTNLGWVSLPAWLILDGEQNWFLISLDEKSAILP